MKNNENGRSMVEMLGVLAIIGVLSAGGLAGYSKAMFKHKLNNTIDQITMLVTNIRTIYGTQKNYSGLTDEKAIQLGIVPPVMGKTAGSLTNPFKGKVSINSAEAREDVANTGFIIGYEKLPREACIALATADFGSGAGSGFVGVDVVEGGAAVNVSEPQSTVYIGQVKGTNVRGEGFAYEMSDAIAACKDSEQNTIIWKFY